MMEIRRYRVVIDGRKEYFMTKKCALDFAKTDSKSKVYQNVNLPSNNKIDYSELVVMEEKWKRIKKN